MADWPLLNALLNTASGASWVSFHHGGGVGMGYSLHAGVVIVADGSEPMGTEPEVFRQYLLADMAKWAKLVKESGAKLD